MKSPYKIRLKFKQVVNILLFGSVLCIMSLLFISVGFMYDKIYTILFQLLGIFVLLFFMPLLMYMFFKFITLRPAVIISEEGITDKSQLYGFGFIKWEEIKSISTGSKHSVSFLTIETYDPDLVKNKAKGPRRWYIKATDFLSSSETQLDVTRYLLFWYISMQLMVNSHANSGKKNCKGGTFYMQ